MVTDPEYCFGSLIVIGRSSERLFSTSDRDHRLIFPMTLDSPFLSDLLFFLTGNNFKGTYLVYLGLVIFDCFRFNRHQAVVIPTQSRDLCGRIEMKGKNRLLQSRIQWPIQFASQLTCVNAA